MAETSRPRIRIIVSDNTGIILEKEFSSFPIGFGRNPTSQVLLPFEFISRSHCVLVEEDEGLVLIDMHSSHGIMVSGQKVDRMVITNDVTFTVKTLNVKIQILDKTQTAAKTSAHTSLTSALTPTPPIVPRAPASQAAHDAPKKEIQGVFTLKNQIHLEAPAPSVMPSPSPLMASHDHGVVVGENRVPLINRDFKPEFMTRHTNAQAAKFRKIEAMISWHEVIYDIQEFDPGDKITVGPLRKADMTLPIFRRTFTVAKVGRENTKCFALKNHKVTILKNGNQYNQQALIDSKVLKQKGQTLVFSMDPQDVTTVDLGSGVELHLRYVPGTRALSRTKMIEPDEAIKQSLLGSGILHVALALIIWVVSPPPGAAPKLKNIPERYARLLVEKPKPKPTPPPPLPKKEEVVKKEPPKPKPVEKVVKQKVMKLPKVLAKVNKYPMEVKHPIPKAPPPVKVEALGALGALGAISKTANPNMVTNININPNAGGLPQKALNTGGIAGALPSSNGKLAAAGGPRVKTKGFGYGTGTGYGIQGLKGTAGTRGVAGAIVGAPKLAAIAKTEGLSRDQVMSVLKQYMGEIQHCYERNLLSNPDLAGRIDFEWDIAASGSVTDVRVKRSTVNGGDGLVDCVKKIFVAMPFPKAKNGQITTPTIGFPFGRL